jgi:hypothetical protein
LTEPAPATDWCDGTRRNSRAKAFCFHGFSKCVFCAFPPRKVKAPDRRCVCCGRWKKPAGDERCPRCVTRAFVALRLFELAA